MPKNKKKDSGSKSEKGREEYGVVLKNDKYNGRIYPQKGRKPLKDEDSYKVV